MDIFSAFILVPYFAVVSAAVAATIGERKGRAIIGALLGLFLGPLGVAITWGMTGNRVPCPHCRERIHRDATACPHCTRSTADGGFEPVLPVDNAGRRVLFIAIILAVFGALAFSWLRSWKERQSPQAIGSAEGQSAVTTPDTGPGLNGRICTVIATAGLSPPGLALFDGPRRNATLIGRLSDGARVCAAETRGSWQFVIESGNHNDGVAGWGARQNLLATAEVCFTE